MVRPAETTAKEGEDRPTQVADGPARLAEAAVRLHLNRLARKFARSEEGAKRDALSNLIEAFEGLDALTIRDNLPDGLMVSLAEAANRTDDYLLKDNALTALGYIPTDETAEILMERFAECERKRWLSFSYHDRSAQNAATQRKIYLALFKLVRSTVDAYPPLILSPKIFSRARRQLGWYAYVHTNKANRSVGSFDSRFVDGLYRAWNLADQAKPLLKTNSASTRFDITSLLNDAKIPEIKLAAEAIIRNPYISDIIEDGRLVVVLSNRGRNIEIVMRSPNRRNKIKLTLEPIKRKRGYTSVAPTSSLDLELNDVRHSVLGFHAYGYKERPHEFAQGASQVAEKLRELPIWSAIAPASGEADAVVAARTEAAGVSL